MSFYFPVSFNFLLWHSVTLVPRRPFVTLPFVICILRIAFSFYLINAVKSLQCVTFAKGVQLTAVPCFRGCCDHYKTGNIQSLTSKYAPALVSLISASCANHRIVVYCLLSSEPCTSFSHSLLRNNGANPQGTNTHTKWSVSRTVFQLNPN